MIFKPFYYMASLDYKLSDERLKYLHIMEAVNYARVAQIPLTYFEFGCHSGRTFSAAIRAADYLLIKEMKFYAFDSFQGLPKTNVEIDGYFKEGSFATSTDVFLTKVRQYTGRTLNLKNVVEGFYEDSLTATLQSNMPMVGIVHIDVDLYSSTKQVLEFIKPLIVSGTVILFDDYYAFPPDGKKGEMRAFKEFINENQNISVREWKAYSTFGQSFFIIFKS